MELLFAAILPGWAFAKGNGIEWPDGLPRHIVLRLMLTVLVCEAQALLRHGRPLRLLPPKRRQAFVQQLASGNWPWLRGSLALARSMALLTSRRRLA